MKTRIFSTTEKDIEQAAQIIAEGGLVAFPTETVYGLGADALNEEAVANIYKAKGRPSDNPMIVHIAEKKELEKLTVQCGGDVEKLAKVFWPGPMTMVLRKKVEVPARTTGGLETVAVRMPDSETALMLIAGSGCPIAAPSANISGRPSPTRASDVIADMDGKIDGIISGDDCRVGIESTVIDMTGEVPVILRPGVLTAREISEVLGKPVIYDKALSQKPDEKDFKPKSPGMKYRHYAPKAEMVIVQGTQSFIDREIYRIKKEREKKGEKVGVIAFTGEGRKAFEAAAHDFFARLRDLDNEGVDVIIAGALDQEDQVGFAVMNRMFKSAGYNVIKENEKMKIAIASDHGGYELKEAVKKYLESRDIQVTDLGTDSEESVDYPKFGKACGEAVASGEADRGIVCCGTGIGISIAANKVKGVRCALCTDVHMAEMTRKHNDANILAMGGRTTKTEIALAITAAWLDTEFEGGRHQRRVDMLNDM